MQLQQEGICRDFPGTITLSVGNIRVIFQELHVLSVLVSIFIFVSKLIIFTFMYETIFPKRSRKSISITIDGSAVIFNPCLEFMLSNRQVRKMVDGSINGLLASHSRLIPGWPIDT